MLYQELMQAIIKKAQLDAEHSQEESLSITAIKFNTSYQKAIFTEITQLKNIINLSKQKESDLSYENFKKKVFDRMEEDLIFIGKISEIFKDHSGKFHYPATTNKIKSSITHTKTFLEENFDRLYDGENIEGYGLGSPEDVNTVGYREESAWGSVKIISLQVGLLYMVAALTGKRLFKDIEFALYQDTPHFADQSAICHIEPFSLLHSKNIEKENSASKKGIELIKDIENINNFSWLFSDEITELGLLTVPGGYSFGGGRGSTRHPRDVFNPSKERPTHDCSSYFADVAKVPYIVSTMQQHEAWRKSTIIQKNDVWDHDKMSNYGAAVSNHTFTAQEVEEYNEAVDYITKNFPAVNLTDPQKQLNGDSVYIKRVFKPGDKSPDGAAGGHTAFVLGVSNDGKSVVIETNRNIDAQKVKDTYVGYGSIVRPLCEDVTTLGNTPVIRFAQKQSSLSRE